MDEKKKIQKVAHGFNIAIKVIRILALVSAGIALTLAIVLFILAGVGTFTKLYEAHPEIGKYSVDIGSKWYFGLEYSDITIEEIYKSGPRQLDILVASFGAICVAAVIECIVIYVILIFFKRVFNRLEVSESPFTLESAKDIRIAFILITILVAFNSLVLGFVLAGLLACMYVMYKYGCQLQKNEDETL